MAVTFSFRDLPGFTHEKKEDDDIQVLLKRVNEFKKLGGRVDVEPDNSVSLALGEDSDKTKEELAAIKESAVYKEAVALSTAIRNSRHSKNLYKYFKKPTTWSEDEIKDWSAKGRAVQAKEEARKKQPPPEKLFDSYSPDVLDSLEKVGGMAGLSASMIKETQEVPTPDIQLGEDIKNTPKWLAKILQGGVQTGVLGAPHAIASGVDTAEEALYKSRDHLARFLHKKFGSPETRTPEKIATGDADEFSGIGPEENFRLPRIFDNLTFEQTMSGFREYVDTFFPEKSEHPTFWEDTVPAALGSMGAFFSVSKFATIGKRGVPAFKAATRASGRLGIALGISEAQQKINEKTGHYVTTDPSTLRSLSLRDRIFMLGIGAGLGYSEIITAGKLFKHLNKAFDTKLGKTNFFYSTVLKMTGQRKSLADILDTGITEGLQEMGQTGGMDVGAKYIIDLEKDIKDILLDSAEAGAAGFISGGVLQSVQIGVRKMRQTHENFLEIRRQGKEKLKKNAEFVESWKNGQVKVSQQTGKPLDQVVKEQPVPTESQATQEVLDHVDQTVTPIRKAEEKQSPENPKEVATETEMKQIEEKTTKETIRNEENSVVPGKTDADLLHDQVATMNEESWEQYKGKDNDGVSQNVGIKSPEVTRISKEEFFNNKVKRSKVEVKHDGKIFTVRSLHLPELHRIATHWLGKEPKLLKEFVTRTSKRRISQLGLVGRFKSDKTKKGVKKQIELIKGNSKIASQVLGHEIGHLVDSMSSQTGGVRATDSLWDRLINVKESLTVPLDIISRGTVFNKVLDKRVMPGAVEVTKKKVLDPETGTRKKKVKTKVKERPKVYAEPDVEQLTETIQNSKVIDFIQKQGITEEQLVEELKNLTRHQVPGVSYFEQVLKDENTDGETYTAKEKSIIKRDLRTYYFNRGELYANAFSVLLNDPQTFMQKAPVYAELFFRTMREAKPEFVIAYEQMQKLLEDPGQLAMKHIQQIIRQQHESQNKSEFMHDADARAGYWGMISRFLFDRDRPVYVAKKRTKRLGKKDPNVKAKAANLVHDLTESFMISSEIEEYSKTLIRKIITPGDLWYKEAIGTQFNIDEIFNEGPDNENIDLDVPIFIQKNPTPRESVISNFVDLMGIILMNRRIAAPRKKGGRFDLDNPGAMQPEDAIRNLKEVENRLGPEGWKVANIFADRLHELRTKFVIPRMKESGIISEEMFEHLEQANSYAKFSVIHYMGRNLKSDLSTGKNSNAVVGSGAFHMFKQVGTWGAIENAFQQTILQDYSILRAAKLNEVKLSMIDFLSEVSDSPFQNLIDQPGWLGEAVKGTTPTYSVTELTFDNNLLTVKTDVKGNTRWEPVDPKHALTHLHSKIRTEKLNKKPDLEKIRAIENTISELEHGPNLTRRASIVLNVEGKAKYYYIDKHIAESILYEPQKMSLVNTWLKNLAHVSRELMITKNIGFITVNALRDQLQTWHQYSEIRPTLLGGFWQIPRLVQLVGRSYKEAWRVHRPFDVLRKIDRGQENEEPPEDFRFLKSKRSLTATRIFSGKDMSDAEKIEGVAADTFNNPSRVLDSESDRQSRLLASWQVAGLGQFNNYLKSLFRNSNPELTPELEAVRKHWLVKIPGLVVRARKKTLNRQRQTIVEKGALRWAWDLSKSMWDNTLEMIDRTGRVVEQSSKLYGWKVMEETRKLQEEKDTAENALKQPWTVKAFRKPFAKKDPIRRTEKERLEVIRNLTGTPNWSRQGQGQRVMNNLFMFSNINKEGKRSAWESILEDPQAYFIKSFEMYVFPQIMLNILASVFEPIEEIVNNVAEHEWGRYLIVPLPFLRTKSGDYGYFNLPTPFEGQLIGKFFHMFLSQMMIMFSDSSDTRYEDRPEWKDVLEHGWREGIKELPWNMGNLNAFVKQIWDFYQYYGEGVNPHDSFRDRPVLTQAEADRGGMDAFNALTINAYNQTGFSALYRLENYNYREIPSDDLYKHPIWKLPGFSIFKRFFKTTALGRSQRLARIKEQNKRLGRDIRASVTDNVVDSFNGMFETLELLTSQKVEPGSDQWKRELDRSMKKAEEHFMNSPDWENTSPENRKKFTKSQSFTREVVDNWQEFGTKVGKNVLFRRLLTSPYLSIEDKDRIIVTLKKTLPYRQWGNLHNALTNYLGIDLGKMALSTGKRYLDLNKVQQDKVFKEYAQLVHEPITYDIYNKDKTNKESFEIMDNFFSVDRRKGKEIFGRERSHPTEWKPKAALLKLDPLYFKDGVFYDDAPIELSEAQKKIFIDRNEMTTKGIKKLFEDNPEWVIVKDMFDEKGIFKKSFSGGTPSYEDFRFYNFHRSSNQNSDDFVKKSESFRKNIQLFKEWVVKYHNILVRNIPQKQKIAEVKNHFNQINPQWGNQYFIK